jgi:hypothetical protein
MIIHKSATRVPENTPEHLNDRILDRTADSVARVVAGGPEAIHRRLEQLDGEWDIERAIMTHAAVLGLGGLALGKLKHRSFYVASFGALGFLLGHALQGWYPPMRPMRALGFRTPREIEDERHALLDALQRMSERL